MSSKSNQNSRMRHSQPKPKAAAWAVLIGILFIAANMRAPLTSVGPLIGLIREHMHISSTLAGMITTLPLLAFAIFSPFVPRLGRKLGIERIILASVLFLTIGIVLRSLSGITTLYLGTAILGLSIAVCNVLLPSLIKREFPERIGLMTGMYSISMNLFGAAASGISVPLAIGMGLGWQGALGVWGVLSFVSILCWLPHLKRHTGGVAVVQGQVSGRQVNLWRSPLAWQVTMFMGLQSMVFYVIIAWLPEILQEQGISADRSGLLLSVMQLALLPFTFIVPVMAGRMRNQRLLVTFTFGLLLFGTLGLLYGSSALIIVWMIIIGIGGGFAFGLAMMFFGLRTENAHQAAELSGMAQSVGYLLAAIGPTMFGYLHDMTGGWTLPLWILVGASILIFIFGLGAGRDRYVNSGKQTNLEMD